MPNRNITTQALLLTLPRSTPREFNSLRAERAFFRVKESAPSIDTNLDGCRVTASSAERNHVPENPRGAAPRPDHRSHHPQSRTRRSGLWMMGAVVWTRGCTARVLWHMVPLRARRGDPTSVQVRVDRWCRFLHTEEGTLGAEGVEFSWG